MKYLKRELEITDPKLIYEAQVDYSKDDLASKYTDDAWRVIITMGDGIALEQWGKFVRNNYKNAVEKFAEILQESQSRTNSNEVYYSVEVKNKIAKVCFYVA